MSVRPEHCTAVGIEDILGKICSYDPSQMEVVASNSPRIFVTAPAGYGKTATMTGKIVYELATGAVPSPKEILALTFSVNAARSMRSKADAAFNDLRLRRGVNFQGRVYISNYHGLARRILSLYGRSLGIDAAKLGKLKICDEVELPQELNTVLSLQGDATRAMSDFPDAIKRADQDQMRALMPSYNKALIEVAIPNGMLTYNGVITLALKLLMDYPNLRNFYTSLFKSVMIDEAQDTNILHYELLSSFITQHTRCCFFGDPLQRVYGFLGAISDFKSRAKLDFDLYDKELTMNHRFDSHPELLKLDRNLRAIIKGDTNHSNDDARIDVCASSSYDGELDAIQDFITTICDEEPTCTISLLVNRRGVTADRICRSFNESNINLFNNLFRDESTEYVELCHRCMASINEQLSEDASLSSREATKMLRSLAGKISCSQYEYGESYALLLNALAKQVAKECERMNGRERYDYISGVFSSRALRRYAAFVDAQVSISTIHASKGLEWDYVLIPGVTKWDFAALPCGSCSQRGCSGTILSGLTVCRLTNVRNDQCHRLQDSLNMWYVAVTRAKKRVIAFTSYERPTKSGSYQRCPASCLLGLPKIKPRLTGYALEPRSI